MSLAIERLGKCQTGYYCLDIRQEKREKTQQFTMLLLTLKKPFISPGIETTIHIRCSRLTHS